MTEMLLLHFSMLDGPVYGGWVYDWWVSDGKQYKADEAIARVSNVSSNQRRIRTAVQTH